MDYTKQTLGELLTHKNETIKRNAMSILKTLQKLPPEVKTERDIAFDTMIEIEEDARNLFEKHNSWFSDIFDCLDPDDQKRYKDAYKLFYGQKYIN